jgi:RND family efflux transporter MFP subunit
MGRFMMQYKVRMQRGDLLCGMLLLLGSVPWLAGCPKNEYVPPPPPNVTVAQPVEQPVTEFLEFTGRTDAFETVEVRARVQGFLEKTHFEDGAPVEAGDLLYTIEQGPYKASLQSAQAQLAQAEAEINRTQFDYNKMQDLYKESMANDQELSDAKSAYEAAQAAKLAADAAIASATLDLGYTEIRAPIAGTTDRSRVDVGNLVGRGEPTLLTTIVRRDPIYVYFNANERDALRFRRERIESERAGRPDAPVHLVLVDGSEYPITGRIDYVDNEIDPNTGTIQVRAVFDNPDELILPGLFVRVRIPLETKEAILVPESALQRDLAGYFLLVADESGKVARADVEIGMLADRFRAIESGLKGDERVIVNGLQRARPGVTVTVETTTLEVPASSVSTTQPAEPRTATTQKNNS